MLLFFYYFWIKVHLLKKIIQIIINIVSWGISDIWVSVPAEYTSLYIRLDRSNKEQESRRASEREGEIDWLLL
jgi:hypothetical protein